jgi:hypothetical protein
MSSKPRQPPVAPGPLVPFTPNAVSTRHDGWTAARQTAFIEALADTGCVQASCRRVGMSDSSAYRMRLRDPIFTEAWDAALDVGIARLEHAAMARAMGGVPRPIFYKGEQVGEWRHHDERLTMFLLRQRLSTRFGKWAEGQPPPPPGDLDEPAMRVVRAIDHLEDYEDPDCGLSGGGECA